MKMLMKILIIIALISTYAHAVSIDELNKTVVFLRQKSQKMAPIDGIPAELYYRYPNSKEYKPVLETSTGSGFIIKYHDRDYLVTAKHVAITLLPASEIIINLNNGTTTVVTFQSLSQDNAITGAHWFHHPKVDISIHPMAYRSDVDLLSVTENFYPKKEINVKLLGTAYIVGFPMGLGVLDKLSPVAKEAKIASKLTSIATPGIPTDVHFYLLDQALSQGYSGAPVFYIEDIMSGVMVGNQPIKGGEILHLLGVQSSALSDQTGGKISIVAPISYIWDIFESNDFEAYIKGLGLKE